MKKVVRGPEAKAILESADPDKSVDKQWLLQPPSFSGQYENSFGSHRSAYRSVYKVFVQGVGKSWLLNWATLQYNLDFFSNHVDFNNTKKDAVANGTDYSPVEYLFGIWETLAWTGDCLIWEFEEDAQVATRR